MFSYFVKLFKLIGSHLKLRVKPSFLSHLNGCRHFGTHSIRLLTLWLRRGYVTDDIILESCFSGCASRTEISLLWCVLILVHRFEYPLCCLTRFWHELHLHFSSSLLGAEKKRSNSLCQIKRTWDWWSSAFSKGNGSQCSDIGRDVGQKIGS